MQTFDSKNLWAKSDPYHPLYKHMLDVGAVAACLVKRCGSIPGLDDNLTILLAALHDIGKADPFFQNKDQSQIDQLAACGLHLPEERMRFRHERRSADEVKAWLEGLGTARKSAAAISSAINGHHGNFKSGFGNNEYWAEDDEVRQGLVEKWKSLRAALRDRMVEVIHPSPITPPALQNHSAAGMKLAGLIIFADWIASNDDLYRWTDAELLSITEPAAYYAATRQRAQQLVDKMGLVIPPASATEAGLDFAELFPANPTPRRTQKVLIDRARNGLPAGLLIVEAPMGEGKTEAAIYASECWKAAGLTTGAYFALPTMATSNQLHSRYAAFLQQRYKGRTVPRLIHGMAWLMEDDLPTINFRLYAGPDAAQDRAAAQTAQEWFRGSKRAILASEGVGTVDQVLQGALNVKFGALRLFALSGRTLIIDEVHAYDEYMTTLMEILLRWCRTLAVPVILLSATLSARQKARLINAYRYPDTHEEDMPKEEDTEDPATVPYPLVTLVPADRDSVELLSPEPSSENRSVKVVAHPGLYSDHAAIANLAAKQAGQGGCISVIVNTVTDAQLVYAAIKRMELADVETILYHARFCAEDRGAIEAAILSRFGPVSKHRPAKAIVIATQVLEQSLDCDFDLCISQLCPIDLLLQRIGRLHRHSRVRPTAHSEPVVHVLLPDNATLESEKFDQRPYARARMLATAAVLAQTQEFKLPQDFRFLIESVYAEEPQHSDMFDPASAESAAERLSRQQHTSNQRASQVSIQLPIVRHFVQGDIDCSYNAAEEQQDGSYLRPSTREGSSSVQVLVLHDEELLNNFQSPTIPEMKALMMRKVSLPAWWLKDVIPAIDGSLEKQEEGWLRGHTLLITTDRVWLGEDAKGNQVRIADCPNIGLVRSVDDGLTDNAQEGEQILVCPELNISMFVKRSAND